MKRRQLLTMTASLGATLWATRWSVGTSPYVPSPIIPPDTSFVDEVAWLDEVVREPESIASNASFKPVRWEKQPTTLAEWEAQRKGMLAKWIEILGYDPSKIRPKVQTETLEEVEFPSFVRRKIRYEAFLGWPVEAYWLMPKGTLKKGPGVVALHPTVAQSIDEPAGIASSDGKNDGPRALGLHLVRLGFHVLCPRNFLWSSNDRIEAKEQARRWNEEQQRMHRETGRPAMTGMARMLYDTQLGLDLLQSHEGVDPERLSVIGHSLGAKEAIYAAAFDRRVRCAAASEGGVGLTFSNWDAEWYLGSRIREPSFQHDHHELLAMAAPRPILIVAGESADGDRGWPILKAAQEIHRLYGNVRVGQYNHRQGHPMTEEAGRRMVEWLRVYG